jgi:PhoH-like ATPase
MGEKLNELWRDNAEQRLVYDALNCDNIDILAIYGDAGTGKNMVSLANALHQVMQPSKNKKGNYKAKSIFYTRNQIEVGNEKCGYLPGDIGEKFLPYGNPSRSTLQKLLDIVSEGTMDVGQLEKDRKYVEYPISYIRGMTIDDAFLIYDECSNATTDDLQTFITRAGMSSKVILLGSLNQIDRRGNTYINNGLYQVIKKYKGQKNFACIKLNNQERSCAIGI